MDEASQIRSLLVESATAYGDGALSLAEHLAGTARMRLRLIDAEQRASMGTEVPALRSLDTNDLAGSFMALDLPGQRQIIADWFDGFVLLSPGRGVRTFDTTTVKHHWCDDPEAAAS